MPYLDIFNPETTKSVLSRLEKLTANTTPEWGKMNAAQMLAHLNVGYDLTYHNTNANYGWFTKMMLKLFVKKSVVGEKPYPKNSRTGPDFLITEDKNFEKEKTKLVNHIKATEKKGAAFFEGYESQGFGELTSKEWSNLFYKHIDHHFTQFGL